jgi:hypothetical protein
VLLFQFKTAAVLRRGQHDERRFTSLTVEPVAVSVVIVDVPSGPAASQSVAQCRAPRTTCIHVDARKSVHA